MRSAGKNKIKKTALARGPRMYGHTCEQMRCFDCFIFLRNRILFLFPQDQSTYGNGLFQPDSTTALSDPVVPVRDS